FVHNHLDSPFSFLSAFTPQSATPDLRRTTWMLSLKDQAYLSQSTLLELGIAGSEYQTDERPHGTSPYLVLPEGVAGNYYRTLNARDRRFQAIANLYLPAQQWFGRHEIRLGADFTDLTRREDAHRGATLALREDGTLARR